LGFGFRYKIFWVLGVGIGFGYKNFWVLGMGFGFGYKIFGVLGLGIYTQPKLKPKTQKFLVVNVWGQVRSRLSFSFVFELNCVELNFYV
jgi:hypothetical protein